MGNSCLKKKEEPTQKSYSYLSYFCKGISFIGCCPCFDFFINEATFIANGKEKYAPESKTDPVVKTSGYDIFKGNYTVKVNEEKRCCTCQPCVSCDLSAWVYNTVLGCIYWCDKKPQVYAPNPSDEQKKKKVGVIKSLDELYQLAENGDLIVQGADELICKEICGLTKSNLSHCCLVITDQDNTKNKKIYQSSITNYLNGCGGRDLKFVIGEFAKFNCWAFLLKLKPEYRQIFNKNIAEVNKFLKDCNFTLGGKDSLKRYDMAANFRLRYIIKLINSGKSITSDKLAELFVQHDNLFYMNCAEFIGGAYLKGGIINKNTNCSLVTPENITWPSIYEGYYQLFFNNMVDNQYAKYLKSFGTVDPDKFDKVVNSFKLDP